MGIFGDSKTQFDTLVEKVILSVFVKCNVKAVKLTADTAHCR